MGWLQDTLWNNLFKYAYPISFLGSMAYGILSIAQVDASSIVANKNIIIVINAFIGLCGLLGFAAWFDIDVSMITDVTKFLDLDANVTKSKVNKQN
jgi:hypothetical protein